MRRGVWIAIAATAAALSLPAGAGAAPACTISGTAGVDILRGTNGADVICAGAGKDRAFGRGGDDVIRGGPGGDVLVGGRGGDRMLGGGGRDTCWIADADSLLRGCERRPAKRQPRKRRSPAVRADCCFIAPGGPGPDQSAPVINGVHFTEPYVDLSAQRSIGLWVDARDDQNGVLKVDADVEGPSGLWRRLAFESDNRSNGVSTDLDVPLDTSKGQYRVVALSVADGAGNRIAFDRGELEDAGFDADFTVFLGPDTEGPELTGYSLAPASLDTSAGPGSVRFSLTATDELSGVDDAAALIQLPGSDPPICFPCGFRGSSQLYSGTVFDGTWHEDLPMPRFARTGTYDIAAVVLYDRAGNSTDYDRTELEELGYPLEFTQTGSGDNEPPQVVNFWMTPGTLQTSRGNRTIEFFVHVRDDLSGIGETATSVFEELRVDIEPPHASEWGYWEGDPTLVSGTELDGVWRFVKGLPEDAEIGTWTIPSIAFKDRAGNETLLRKQELIETGWDLTFENLP